MSDLDELAEDIWMMVAEVNERIEAIAEMIKRRDQVALGLAKQLEREVRRNEDLMRALGISELVRQANREKGTDIGEIPTLQPDPRMHEYLTRTGALAGQIAERIKRSRL